MCICMSAVDVSTIPCSPSGFVTIGCGITNEMESKTETWWFGEKIGIFRPTIIHAAGTCYHMHVMWSFPWAGLFHASGFSYQKRVLGLYAPVRNNQEQTTAKWSFVWKLPTGKERTQFWEMLFMHSCACASSVSLLVNSLPHHLVIFNKCAELRALSNHKISKVTRSGSCSRVVYVWTQ